MAAAPDWSILVTHLADTPCTHTDQWVDDDAAGHLWIIIGGELIDLSVGNTAATIRHDRLTPARERAELAGGIGYFAEIARLSQWLGPADTDERRRRLGLCVEPPRYPVVLTSTASRYLSARHVHQQITGEWGQVEPAYVLGYLHALTDWAPATIQDRLYRMSAMTICDPNTQPKDRALICDQLRSWRQQTCSRTQVLAACCLFVLADERATPVLHASAEQLLIQMHGR